jgi:hypothetical protein
MIKKIKGDVSKHKDKKAVKELEHLEKADRKRDKLVEKGKKAMKGKC